MFLGKLRNRGASDSNKYEEEHTVKKYGVNELRQMFLDFFESKGHLVMNSFSLVFRREPVWLPARNVSVPVISRT